MHKLPTVMNDEITSRFQTKNDGDASASVLPPTYMVLRVAKETPDATITWLVDKIRGIKRDGGAELLVMKQPFYPKEDYVLHISASKIKLLEAAEDMELMKANRSGEMREFTIKQLDDFLPEDMSIEDMFTPAEKQVVVRHELENIRALAEDQHVPGFADMVLYEGQSIIAVLKKMSVVTQMYPLHDKEQLKKLGQNWYLAKSQPFEEIRLYFGESIALYFTFLGFYTKSLLVPVALSLLQLLIPSESLIFFCVFNVVWVTLVLELWKKKSNELAFKWGTIGMTSLDQPRANFQGALGKDAITGKIVPQYPRYFTYLKLYCVSFPLVLLCMLAAFLMMLCSFWAEEYVKTMEAPHNGFVAIPSIVYSVLVVVMNTYYRKLATRLTEWENHRTDSQFNRHKVTKLVMFEFVNNFMSLFYIAFVIQDMEMLRNQLQTMLIISQSINNFQEAFLPLILQYYSKKVTQRKKKVFISRWKIDKQRYGQASTEDHSECESIKTLPQIDVEESRFLAATAEGDLDVYEETYDDYLELFVQFGYVFLFSPVYPMAALWALVNNMIEIRADAFKLCQLSQRPISARVKDIGAWQRVFEALSALSIITNCGLLYLNPSIRSKAPNLSQVEWLLLFVFLEHVLLAVRYLLHITIADKPEWVRVALARHYYESKQALKKERETNNKRVLTKKFKSYPNAAC